MDRYEAIQLLRLQGLDAKARDWAPGRTIMILVGPGVSYQGVVSYDNIVYLTPEDCGSWMVLDEKLTSRSMTVYPDLESAVARIGDYIKFNGVRVSK